MCKLYRTSNNATAHVHNYTGKDRGRNRLSKTLPIRRGARCFGRTVSVSCSTFVVSHKVSHRKRVSVSQRLTEERQSGCISYQVIAYHVFYADCHGYIYSETLRFVSLFYRYDDDFELPQISV